MKTIALAFVAFISFSYFSAETSNAGVVVTQSNGTYFTDGGDAGGCILSGKCLSVVVTPNLHNMMGSMESNCIIESTDGSPFTIKFHANGTDEIFQEVNAVYFEQRIDENGNKRFVYTRF